MPNSQPTDTAARARALLRREVRFDLRARGRRDVLTGTLVAYIPMGATLAEATVKVDDPSMFDGLESPDERRLRAEVAIIRTNDPETGAVRFFTPRVQQVRGLS